MNGFLLRAVTIFSAIIIMSALSACDTVLQYPEEPGGGEESPKEITLNISADKLLDLLGEYEYDSKKQASPTRVETDNHQFRMTLNVYRSDDKSEHPVSVYRAIFTYPVSSELEEVVRLELLPGDYRLVIWADYVDSGSEADKYYDTSDFSEIILNGNGDGGHSGSNNYRDAFYGETSLLVPKHPESEITASMRLERPMAKYTFVSNDLREFLNKETLSNRDADGTSPALSDYTVRMVYTQYMPCSFNAHTGKPADSRLGVEYRSSISVIDDDKVQLAFDYIFTNGGETSVAVAMEVLYKDGAVVSRIPSFDVPLKRSHHTIVIGKFLTTKSGGPIGINPGFGGDFIIEIK